MLRKLYQKWMVIANAIGNFNSRVVLSILYALVVLPFGLLVKIFLDPLRIKRSARGKGWSDVEAPTLTVEDGRRQF